MNGPENYSEAERLLRAADGYEAGGDPQTANARRTEALTRAVLALTASHATSAHPDSTSWDRAINAQEQP